MSKKKAVSAVFLAVLASPAFADPLFGVSATGGGNSVSVSGSSLPDLLDDSINASGSFSSLKNTDASVNVTYAGIKDAIQLSVNAAGTSATLALPGIGFSKTFTGSTREELQTQIEDFLKKDGAETYLKFLASVNQQTVAAVVDGNPSAQTAVMAQRAFSRWGSFGGGNMMESKDGMYSNIRVIGTQYTLDNYSSTLASVELSLGYRINEYVGVFGTLTPSAQDTEGAQIGRIAYELAVPVTVYGKNGFSVVLTPQVQAGGAASVDLLNGGVFWGVGGAGRVGYDLGAGWKVGVGAQYLKDTGLPVKVGDMEFRTEVDQSVLSYGVDVGWDFSEKVGLVGGVSQHRLLADAAEGKWLEPTAGIRWGKTTLLEAGYEGTLGSRVKGHGAYLRFGWRW